MNRGSWSSRSSSTAAVVAATSSCCLGPSTPGQTRTPNEENGTPKRDFFFFSGLCVVTLHITSMHCVRISIADRAPRCIADRGTAEAAAQQQQHSSSSTAAVVAATSWLRTKRTSVHCTGEPFVFVLALSRNLKRTSADTTRSLVTTGVLL